MAEKHDRSIYDAPALAGVLCGFNFQGGSMLGLSRKETDNELTTAMAKGRVLDPNLLQDLAVEDLYDEQILPEKKRRLTPGQEEIAYYSRRPCLHFKVSILERSFEEGKKLLPERKSELARKLGLHPRQIAIWFQNRKARWKTKQLERDFHQLKSSYDKLLSDHNSLRARHDSILNHNQQLLHQVASLNERLREKEWIRDDKWTDGVIETTTTTAHESKLPKEAEIEANVSCTIISQGIVMKAPQKSSMLEEVHLDGKDAGTVHNIDVVSIKEDGELGIMAATTKLESGGELPYYLEIEAGAESHHNYMIFSEDQQGINGVCFSDDMIYTTGEESGAFVVEHHQPLIREDEGAGMSWWIWH